MRNRGLTGLILVVVAVLLAACSDLAGEPEIVGQVPVQQQAQNIEVVAPDIEPNLLLGERIFAENCVRCHGFTGAGDGEFAISGQVQNLPDFTDPARHEDKSAYDYYRQVTLGNIESLMPPFSGSLSDEERWAVANFVFTLVDAPVSIVAAGHSGTDSSTTTEEDVATSDESSEEILSTIEAIGTISGTVTLATEGETLPDGLIATLYIFDADMNEQSFETTIDAEGIYQFTDVTIDNAHGYYVGVQYSSGTFNSEFLLGNPENGNMTLDLIVYDVTDDPAALQLNSVATQIDLLSDDTLRIWQMYRFTNISDKVYSLGAESGHQLSVRVPVPENAVLSDDNDLTRYIFDEDGGYIYDTEPIRPGDDHNFYLQYSLAAGSLELSQTFDYVLTGEYEVFVDDSVFSLNADGWYEIPSQDFQGAIYIGLGIIGNEQPLAIEVNRKWFNFDKQFLGIVMTVIGVIFIGLAAFLFFIGSKSSETVADSQGQIQVLMKQIADLDDRYQAKDIGKSTYKKQRSKLKTQLTELMKAE